MLVGKNGRYQQKITIWEMARYILWVKKFQKSEKRFKLSVDKYVHILYTKRVGCDKRDLSSAGRASALQAEGHRFEPCRSHYYIVVNNLIWRDSSVG